VVLAAPAAPGLAGAAEVEPFRSPPDPAALVEEERRVWSAGDDLDRSIRRARNLVRDEALLAYVGSILDGLYPDFRDAIVLKGVLRDADPNAFVLPNGSVYLTLGLVGLLDSEAQMAMVLGHEAAHFVYRHGYQQMSNAKSMSAFGVGLTVLTGGIGAIGSLALAGAFFGYSRDHEREADRGGFERVVRSGYPPQAGVEAFELLAADAKLYDRKQPTFFASHPSMLERTEVFRGLIAALPAGQVGGQVGGQIPAADADPARAARYRQATARARLEYLRLAAETGRHRSIVVQLEAPFRAGGVDPAAAFWLGEAYRLRADEGDLERAAAVYRAVLERDPGQAAAWRGLGEISRRAGSTADAADAFRRYLDGAPDAVDREAIARRSRPSSGACKHRTEADPASRNPKERERSDEGNPVANRRSCLRSARRGMRDGAPVGALSGDCRHRERRERVHAAGAGGMAPIARREGRPHRADDGRLRDPAARAEPLRRRQGLSADQGEAGEGHRPAGIG
jgi:predicted Zn-dependent protease